MSVRLLPTLILLCSAAGCHTGASASGQQAPAAAAAQATLSQAEAEVRALERQWLDAYERNDTAAMDRIVADDFTITFPSGEIDTKAELLEQMRALGPGPNANRYRTRGVASRAYGDTVILTGIVVTETVRDGRQLRDQASYTDVYVRRDGRWQVVASHLSGAPED